MEDDELVMSLSKWRDRRKQNTDNKAVRDLESQREFDEWRKLEDGKQMIKKFRDFVDKSRPMPIALDSDDESATQSDRHASDRSSAVRISPSLRDSGNSLRGFSSFSQSVEARSSFDVSVNGYSDIHTSSTNNNFPSDGKVIKEIRVTKNTTGRPETHLGLTFSGGSDLGRPVRVELVKYGSSAEMGQVKCNDEILAINDISVEDKSLNETLAVLQREELYSKFILFRVRRIETNDVFLKPLPREKVPPVNDPLRRISYASTEILRKSSSHADISHKRESYPNPQSLSDNRAMTGQKQNQFFHLPHSKEEQKLIQSFGQSASLRSSPRESSEESSQNTKKSSKQDVHFSNAVKEISPDPPMPSSNVDMSSTIINPPISSPSTILDTMPLEVVYSQNTPTPTRTCVDTQNTSKEKDIPSFQTPPDIINPKDTTPSQIVISSVNDFKTIKCSSASSTKENVAPSTHAEVLQHTVTDLLDNDVSDNEKEILETMSKQQPYLNKCLRGEHLQSCNSSVETYEESVSTRVTSPQPILHANQRFSSSTLPHNVKSPTTVLHLSSTRTLPKSNPSSDVVSSEAPAMDFVMRSIQQRKAEMEPEAWIRRSHQGPVDVPLPTSVTITSNPPSLPVTMEELFPNLSQLSLPVTKASDEQLETTISQSNVMPSQAFHRPGNGIPVVRNTDSVFHENVQVSKEYVTKFPPSHQSARVIHGSVTELPIQYPSIHSPTSPDSLDSESDYKSFANSVMSKLNDGDSKMVYQPRNFLLPSTNNVKTPSAFSWTAEAQPPMSHTSFTSNFSNPSRPPGNYPPELRHVQSESILKRSGMSSHPSHNHALHYSTIQPSSHATSSHLTHAMLSSTPQSKSNSLTRVSVNYQQFHSQFPMETSQMKVSSSSEAPSGGSDMLPPPLPPKPKHRQQPSQINSQDHRRSGEIGPRVPRVRTSNRCSHCHRELGHGAVMVIESLAIYFHIHCFVCRMCNMALGDGSRSADVRVRDSCLYCPRCFQKSS